jgi:predicted alpha/beta superfamily hydrolase
MDEIKVDIQEKGIWIKKLGEAQHMPVLLCLGGDDFAEQFQDIEPMLMSAIQKGECRPFIVSSYLSQNWEKDYTPWPAPSLFKKAASFEGGAAETLSWTLTDWIPYVVKMFGLLENKTQFYCMGYSLAGLCALWMLYESTRFSGCACCSGSLWYDNWMDYVNEHTITCPDSRIYLSIGNEEANTRNKRMAQVVENTKLTYKRLTADSNVSDVVLHWNEGGHFTDVANRQAKAIQWLMQNS